MLRVSMRTKGAAWRAGFLLAAAGLMISCAAAQEAPPAKPPAQAESTADISKPVLLPADALQAAADFVDAAPESVRKWCRTYGRKKLRVQGNDFSALDAAVTAQFPKASPAARDAAAFLALYYAYESARITQESAADQLKETQRLIDRAESQRPYVRRDLNASEELEGRLVDLDERRRAQADTVDRIGKVVDKYLAAIAEFFPRVKGADAKILRSLV